MLPRKVIDHELRPFRRDAKKDKQGKRQRQGPSFQGQVQGLDIQRLNPLIQRQLLQIAAVQRVQRHTGLTHHFFIFDIRALWCSLLSARAPECQKLKMVG